MIAPKNDDIFGRFFSIESPFEEINSLLNDARRGVSPDTNYHNWSNLPGCYGTYCGDPAKLKVPYINDFWPSISPVLDQNNFTGKGQDCLKLIENIINQPAYNGNRHTLRSTKDTFDINQVYDISTGTFIDNIVRGITYTLYSLKEGSPVIFGVNCQPNTTADNIDKSTNHYIIVVGIGNDGRNYLLGWDVACLLSTGEQNQNTNTKEGISQFNKIYLDKDWPGLLTTEISWPNFYSCARQPYKVTQILRTFIY